MTHPAHHRNGRLIDMAQVTQLLTELSQRPMTMQDIQDHVGVSKQSAFRLLAGMRKHLRMEIACEGWSTQGTQGVYAVRGWGVLDPKAFAPAPVVRGSPKVDCHKCGGYGWLRGRELDCPDEDTYQDTMTKYPCDGEAHKQADECAADEGFQ